ncbi:MAG: glutamyl-tRNA reductase, partial [Candidatus Eremiobacteraeota bacterium]|nr:glutamyl-tRNA reductase [Candidatus Eremiobacteraeota bacterium]
VQAQHAKSLGKVLHRLFRDALKAGKTARAQTSIAHESSSIATAAVDAATVRLGSIHGKSVVVIGAGKMGRSALKRLRHEGAAQVVVANRTVARAREAILETGFGEALEMPGLVDALAVADLVVASTGASHFILNPERVGAAMARRPERPLFIVDIAVPRDADPAVAEIPNVTLIDIDGLKSVVDAKLQTRRAAIPQVEEIVEECAAGFGEWYRSRVAVPVIETLTRKAEAVRASEVERLFSRCPDLTERERLLVSGMASAIVAKLLHSVILKIRATATIDRATALSHARVLDELFELDLAAHIANLVPRATAADADR